MIVQSPIPHSAGVEKQKKRRKKFGAIAAAPFFWVKIFRTNRESGSLGDGRFVGGISRVLRELGRPAAGAQ